ncbi:MAG: DUF1403 family protein [Roseobacter sp.]|nr:DUF1403 family protein [Roseobacter sp.]
MDHARSTFDNDLALLPNLPDWITSGRTKTPEDAAFFSGAALNHLHFVLGRDVIPHALLRERLALRAVEACVVRTGRPERAAELRDAVQFLQPGDRAGPAGETYLCWQRAVQHRLSVKTLHRALPAHTPDAIACWLDVGQGAAVARAAMVLETILTETPRSEGVALILADAALARAFGWAHLVPLLATGMKRADLHRRGDDLRLACHHVLTSAAIDAVRLCSDLARRAAYLEAVAPKLRAKGAQKAVTLFMTRDAVAPAALTSLRSDRAARRFCDRLVALGAVRELTGRDTFRLYGL